MNADQIDEFRPWVKKAERNPPVYLPFQPGPQPGQNSLNNEKVNYLKPPAFALQERQVSHTRGNRLLWPTKDPRKQQHPLKAMALMVLVFTGLMAGAVVIKNLTAHAQPESPVNFKKEIRAVSITDQDPGNDFHMQEEKKQKVLGRVPKTMNLQ